MNRLRTASEMIEESRFLNHNAKNPATSIVIRIVKWRISIN
jgi:hypothetical protein